MLEEKTITSRPVVRAVYPGLTGNGHREIEAEVDVQLERASAKERRAHDRFEALYNGGLLPNAPVVARALAEKRVQAGTAPTEPWALGGCVLTPSARIDPGWVVIEGDHITEVVNAKPE